jgi:hypothetical protein
MQTQNAERQWATRTVGPVTVVAYAGAAAFVIAAAWFWLAVKGVTVALVPQLGPGAGAEQAMRAYYRWMVTTLPQERYYSSIAIAGFLCLAATATAVRDLLGRDRATAGIGALTTGAGSLLWITGNVLVLGGHRAIGLMATHTNPIETTSSIAFTVDTIGEAFSLAAFVLIGVGMLSFATGGRQEHRAWAGYTVVVALVMLVTAGSYAIGDDSFSDLMLFIAGVAVLPLWLIGTSLASGIPAGTAEVPGARPLARSASYGDSDDNS